MALQDTLPKVRPDFDALVAELQRDLSGRDSWKDIFPGSTGQTLLEWMAGVCTFSQHSIEQLFLETFLKTAKRPTSIYTIAHMLGVRIGRKASPVITVQLSRTSSTNPFVVPAWTVWAGSEGSFINTEPVIFDAGVLVMQTQMVAGSILEWEVLSNGQAFQQYRITGSAPFTIHDSYVQIRVANLPWRIGYDGLWSYNSADRVAVDTTTGSGDLLLQFGDDTYGTSPNVNEPINVRWIDTKGLETKPVGSGVRLNSNISQVTAVTVSSLSGGGNEKDPEFYRTMAPYIFQEKNKPYTTNGYTAKFLEYPGVVDALVQSQRDIPGGKYELRLMNNLYVSLLNQDGSVWSNEVDTPMPIQFLPLDSDGGTLPAGSYSYRVSAVNEVGETIPTVAATYIISTPGGILLRWPLENNAVLYRVYGRTAGSEQFMAEVVPTDYDKADGRARWVDDGKVVPNGTPPVVNNTQASWWTFTQWAQNYQHASIRLVQRAPTRIPVDVAVTIYVKPVIESLDGIRAQAYEHITRLFQPRLGSIGRKVALSDIIDACMVPSESDSTVSDVDYVVPLTPTTDQIPPSNTSYLSLASINITVAYTDRRDRWK